MTRTSKSRRRFLRAAAAASAVTLMRPLAAAAKSAAAAAGAKPAPAKPATAGKHLAIPKETEKLKGYVTDALKAVRAHPLPVGSEMAFAFKPVRPRRRTGERSA